MPAVALFSKPNGEPIASTHSPGFSCDGSPMRTVGRFFASILMTATSVRRVDADDLGLELAPVRELHGDLVGIGHDVRVGQDVAVGRDDEARARAAQRLAHCRADPALALIRNRNAEAAEEIVERIIRRDTPPMRPVSRCCWTTSTLTTAGPDVSTSGDEIGQRVRRRRA